MSMYCLENSHIISATVNRMDLRILALILTLVAVGLVNGKRTYFTYTVKNILQQPTINERIKLRIRKGRKLIYYMEDACRKDPDRFTNFTATFKPKIFDGYFIDAINGVAGNWPEHKTFWQIDNAAGPLELGVSKYKPVPNDRIVFNLTQWTGAHP